MIKAETKPDKSIWINSMGSPMELLSEAAAVLANVGENVGRYVMASENKDRAQAEADVMSDIVTLAMMRIEKEREKNN